MALQTGIWADQPAKGIYTLATAFSAGNISYLHDTNHYSSIPKEASVFVVIVVVAVDLHLMSCSRMKIMIACWNLGLMILALAGCR